MNVTSNKRLLALDVMRGITIAGMILVNNPGSWGYVYSPLKHAHERSHPHRSDFSFLYVYHGNLYLHFTQKV